MARPTTKAPETQIYFINYRSGAFPVPRVRTVVRGERASRSIVNRTTALWSIWMVTSLILAGVGTELVYIQTRGCQVAVSRGSNRISKIAQWALIRVRWTLPLTNGRKRTQTRELSSRILFPPSERAPSAPVPSNLYENWAGVYIMYQPDGRRHHQSLVYFGIP